MGRKRSSSKRLNISAETRRKLIEMAKLRWERHRHKDQARGTAIRDISGMAGTKAESWRSDVDLLLRYHPGETHKTKTEALLFFSFLPRQDGYVVLPGYLKAAAVPDELWQDRDAMAVYIIENRNSEPIMYGVDVLDEFQVDEFQWMNATPGWRVLLDNAYANLKTSYYGIERPIEFWDGLANALVFIGSETEPFKETVKVRSGTAPVELEMHREDGGIRLSLVVRLADRNTCGRIRLRFQRAFLRCADCADNACYEVLDNCS